MAWLRHESAFFSRSEGNNQFALVVWKESYTQRVCTLNMASCCVSRQFFWVDEALRAVLDQLDSDPSDNNHLGVCGAIIVGDDHFGLQRYVYTEVDCSDLEDGNNADWDNTYALGNRIASCFIFAQTTKESDSEEEHSESVGTQANDCQDSQEILCEETLAMKPGCPCASVSNLCEAFLL